MFSISVREIFSTVVDLDLNILGRMFRVLLWGKLFGESLVGGVNKGIMLSDLGM
jgi:hypothetical protein